MGQKVSPIGMQIIKISLNTLKMMIQFVNF